jgi:small conductance mechanosensitive channel
MSKKVVEESVLDMDIEEHGEMVIFSLKNAFEILSEKFIEWFELIVRSVPNVLISLVVLILFIMAAKAVKKSSRKIVSKVHVNKSVSNLIEICSFYLVVAVGVFVSLEIMGLEKAVTSILAGAGVLGLALGFAFQEIASNFVSGIFIAFSEPYQIGDVVEIESYAGEVKEINIRTTTITTFDGLEVLIPNKDMFTKSFINYTSTPKRRIDLTVGVAYTDDLELVEKVAKDAIHKTEGVSENEPVEVYFLEFGESSINLVIRFWGNYANGILFFKTRSKAIINIKKEFDKNSINIPFPMRTLQFDGGVAPKFLDS